MNQHVEYSLDYCVVHNCEDLGTTSVTQVCLQLMGFQAIQPDLVSIKQGIA